MWQKTADIIVPLFWLILPKDKTTSFKSKRDAKKKSLSGHDHNWNTLFLGMNAVAEVMADKYNTTKGSILDDASSSSLAVRMVGTWGNTSCHRNKGVSCFSKSQTGCFWAGGS